MVRLNFSVRNGKRWDPHAITTLLPFSPDGASSVPRLCCLKKKPSGGTLRAKTFSRDSTDIRTVLTSSQPVSACFVSLCRNRRTPNCARGALQENFRVISTARLRTLPPVHLPPINVVVFNDPKWRSYLEVGFVLRCFQHLSVPDAATRPCPWRDNRLAGGRSNTVLSY